MTDKAARPIRAEGRRPKRSSIVAVAIGGIGVVVCGYLFVTAIGGSSAPDGSVVIQGDGGAQSRPGQGVWTTGGGATSSPGAVVPSERFFDDAWNAAIASESLTGHPEASAKHALLMREQRDTVWAPQAEQALRERFASLKGANAGQVEIRCGSISCEVRMITDQGDDFMAGKAAVDAFTQQFEWVRRDGNGFRSDPSMHVVFSENDPNRIGVLAYFERRRGR